MTTVGIVTYRREANLTEDDRPLIDDFAALHVAAEPVAWDDPGTDWKRFDALVLRSCWDYHLRPDEFDRWLDTIGQSGVRVYNPVSVVRWNVHKRYLAELGEKGARVPDTEWVARGERRSLADILSSRGWDDVIVKPAVSASAMDTFRTSATSDSGAELFGKLVRRTDMLVQRFADEVVAQGEWSLIFIDGEFTHAVMKRPRAGDFRVQQELGGSADLATPPPAVLTEATRIAGLLPEGWLFTRIDGVETTSGFMLMEAECIEPFLFFALALAPDARLRLARAVVERSSAA